MASDSLANLGFHFNFQKSPVKVKKPQHPKTSPVKVKKSRQPKNSPFKVKKPRPPKKKNFSTHKINPKQSNVAITGKSSPNETKKANYAPPNNSPSIKIPNMPVDILKDMKEVLHLHGLQLQEDSSEEMIHPAFQGNVTMPDLPEAPQTLIQASKGDLCVFCDEPMPLNPSCRLKKLGEYLQAKPEVQHRREPTNPWALHLPFPLTAGYCQMHQAELSIIPHGLSKQWPSTIDFENLPREYHHATWTVQSTLGPHLGNTKVKVYFMTSTLLSLSNLGSKLFPFYFFIHPSTAGINRSNTAVRAVLEQPCSTGGRTGTVRPKQEPTGRTDLSDRSRLVLCDRSQELIGQACPTRRQVLRSDSACLATSQTRLFEHRSNCRV
ncbi:hypothetical protein PCANC_23030 [Puccinia coronata f. sp. avenae]|uniref:Uncharacterized protein n=1 Tax=Puccinia coronata f. sp. avenae TaxID=200324 RepID=A0A2N5TSZ7_9BASI|nr:hypothetical protein PCANC_23030 [Puccinia coronata f. sp. avenae]